MQLIGLGDDAEVGGWHAFIIDARHEPSANLA
jgi:hypothetical protein